MPTFPYTTRFHHIVVGFHGPVPTMIDRAQSTLRFRRALRRYLDLLTQSLVVRQLQPWHENLAKRQVNSPKVYVRDSGLLHALLGIRSERELLTHPKSGASWEGYVLEEILKTTEPDGAYFRATYQGAELDLLLMKKGRRVGIEVKRADAPTLTPSMRIALADLKLDELNVIHPGTRPYELAPRVKVMPVSEVPGLGA
ncbi:MAG: ATP-binding protein [Steroidobacteraceae bacterium]